jgi:hypothetical protein
VVKGRFAKYVMWPLGIGTVAAAIAAAHNGQKDRDFIQSKLTGDKSLCFVEAFRAPIPTTTEPLELWAVNAGVPPLSNTIIAMHDGESPAYLWTAHMVTPCTRQRKAVHGIGLGVFHLEIDDTPGDTTYETIIIKKSGDYFYKKMTISGKWTYAWEGDF